MSPVLTRMAKIARWGIAAAAVGICGFLTHLAYIGNPERAISLQFQGFIRLPKGVLVNVLDYLTVSDQHLFVTSESTGSVYKVNLQENAMLRSTDVPVFVSEPAAHGVAIDPSLQMAYVTRSKVNAVDVFDPSTMRQVARIPVADDPDAIFFDAMHNVIYLANGDANLATLIDPHTHTVIGTIPLGGKPEYAALDPQTKLLYQNLRDTNTVAAVDVTTRSVVQRWPLRGCSEPSGMAIDAAQRRLFIACANNSMLAIFDLNAHVVNSLLSIGGGPDSVAFDADLRRVYTTGKAGVLTVIRQDSPDAYHVLDSVKLHFGAHTLAIDPTTHLLYVAYASLLVPARVAVFAPRP